MQPHEERVVAEQADLDDKITKLGSFLISQIFPNLEREDRELLREQYITMRDYSRILGRRISRFRA